MCAVLFGMMLTLAVGGILGVLTGDKTLSIGCAVAVGLLYAKFVPLGGRNTGQGGGIGLVGGNGNGGNGGGGKGPDRAPNPVCGPSCWETWTGNVPDHVDQPQTAPVIRQEPIQAPERWSAPVREPEVQPARHAPEQPIAVPNWPTRRDVEVDR